MGLSTGAPRQIRFDGDQIPGAVVTIKFGLNVDGLGLEQFRELDEFFQVEVAKTFELNTPGGPFYLYIFDL